MDGIWKFERVPRAFPKRAEVETGIVISDMYTVGPISQSIQLFDVSQGLEYMHNLDCIHGDLKSVRLSLPTSSPVPDTPPSPTLL